TLKTAKRGDRPLHIAALAKQTTFVCKLECLNKGDLELPNKDGETTFLLATISGIVEIAKV
ncbi:Hypothetical predicted protein, partial [Olea europaea subsp. europaea]